MVLLLEYSQVLKLFMPLSQILVHSHMGMSHLTHVHPGGWVLRVQSFNRGSVKRNTLTFSVAFSTSKSLITPPFSPLSENLNNYPERYNLNPVWIQRTVGRRGHTKAGPLPPRSMYNIFVGQVGNTYPHGILFGCGVPEKRPGWKKSPSPLVPFLSGKDLKKILKAFIGSMKLLQFLTSLLLTLFVSYSCH